MARLNIIKVSISHATNLDWPSQQLDVKYIFLNGDLSKEVHMDQPHCFEGNKNNQVCRLSKCLYRLNQSPKAWFEKFTPSW